MTTEYFDEAASKLRAYKFKLFALNRELDIYQELLVKGKLSPEKTTAFQTRATNAAAAIVETQAVIDGLS